MLQPFTPPVSCHSDVMCCLIPHGATASLTHCCTGLFVLVMFCVVVHMTGIGLWAGSFFDIPNEGWQSLFSAGSLQRQFLRLLLVPPIEILWWLWWSRRQSADIDAGSLEVCFGVTYPKPHRVAILWWIGCVRDAHMFVRLGVTDLLHMCMPYYVKLVVCACRCKSTNVSGSSKHATPKHHTGTIAASQQHLAAATFDDENIFGHSRQVSAHTMMQQPVASPRQKSR